MNKKSEQKWEESNAENEKESLKWSSSSKIRIKMKLKNMSFQWKRDTGRRGRQDSESVIIF